MDRPTNGLTDHGREGRIRPLIEMEFVSEKKLNSKKILEHWNKEKRREEKNFPWPKGEKSGRDNPLPLNGPDAICQSVCLSFSLSVHQMKDSVFFVCHHLCLKQFTSAFNKHAYKEISIVTRSRTCLKIEKKKCSVGFRQTACQLYQL